MKIEPTAGKAPVLEDDTYNAVIHNVKPLDLDEPDQFGKTKKLNMQVEVVGQFDEDGEQIYLDPRPNRVLSDGGKSGNVSTLYKICAAVGIDTEEGFDSDDLEGKSCRIVVKTDPPGTWPKITDWLKPKAAQKAATKAVERPQPSLEEEAELTAWFRKWTSKGHERAALVELSEGMFEGRAPGELKPDERLKLEAAIV